MKIEVRLDPEYAEPKLLILADSMSEEVERILRLLRSEPGRPLVGFRREGASPLKEGGISRIYAQQGRVCAATDSGEYVLRQRLYELEEKLASAGFVRISNSELINLRRVRSFDLNLAGTIRVNLDDGTTAWVSRRYVAKIRKILGM